MCDEFHYLIECSHFKNSREKRQILTSCQCLNDLKNILNGPSLLKIAIFCKEIIKVLGKASSKCSKHVINCSSCVCGLCSILNNF